MRGDALFPFSSVRDGQRDFLDDVSDVLECHKNLVAHAPTGIGKTAAVLSPALAYSIERGCTVFFLTPKHTQHTIVVNTLKKIRGKHNLSFSVADFVGKQWMCPHAVSELSSREFHEFCRAKKRDETCQHYLNVHKKRNRGKVDGLVKKILDEPHHSEKIQALCAKHRLCAFEVLVKAGKKADVIVCDYFHVFQPKIREAFMQKLNKKLESSVIIVDEAHNLPERIRNVLTSSLTQNTIKWAAKEANTLGRPKLIEDLKEVNRILVDLGKGLKIEGEKYIRKDEFVEKIAEATGAGCAELSGSLAELGEEVLLVPNRHRSFAKSVSDFLASWGGEDLGYSRILRKGNNLALTYRCLDPEIGCKPVFSKTCGNILMSGTLTPLSMYASVLGLEGGDTVERAYPSPFPRENRLTVIVSGVTTQYSKRSDFMYKKYANTISGLLSCVPGNAAVFFPAYHLMDRILGEMESLKPSKTFVIERKDMKKRERNALYEGLKRSGTGKVLMGVQAGSFSEGVDYPRGLLDAVFVVGLPLEKPNLETQALIDYYDFRFQRGWDFGYTYPAMNRALQAAGRCIRSEEDRGAIILMDERFRWANYSKCFPPEYELTVTETPEKYLKGFFKQD